MDTGSFLVYIKTEDIYSDITKDVETRFDTSNYKFDRPLPKGKNKKATGLIKDEVGGEKIKEFAALRPKRYGCLTDDSNENKKAKRKKKKVSSKYNLKFKIIIKHYYVLTNKTLNPMVTEVFIRGRKLNISFIFITQS